MASNNFLNSIVGSLKEYVPGEQPETNDWIKLNTNEFPYPASPLVKEELKNLTENFESLRKYPHPLAEPLRSKLAKKIGLKPEEVLITNGSDEALVLISRVLLEKGELAALPEITYSFYETILSSIGVKILWIPMTTTENVPFRLDLKALEASSAKAIFLANPNAITGEYLPVAELKKRISSSDKVWILDEAYISFCDMEKPSFIEVLQYEQNVVITQTLSKSHALAGLRVGYLVCKNQEIMSKVYAVKDSYNQDRIAISLAARAIEDEAYYAEKWNEIKKQREFLANGLKSYAFEVIPSQANYILIKPPPKISAEKLYLELKNKKILVRYFKDSLFSDHLRVSIGTPHENKKFLGILTSILDHELSE